MTARVLRPEPLSAKAFAPFGEVVSLEGAEQIPINYGLTTRFNDLAQVDVSAEGGRPAVNVFRSRPVALPHRVRVLERHPLGSQLFYPLSPARFLALVSPGEAPPCADSLVLFLSDGRQGVNFHRNTWHHYHMVLDREADFLVVDRLGEGNNLDEHPIDGDVTVVADDT
ncbi:MAG: ureidoglycolate lyase [Pseudomonadota bacterium]